MKIVSLTAENIKKLKAVHIEPNGNVVMVTGKNGAGKSSVLDSIVYALSGGKALPQKPIRTGADSARVVLDLDEIEVTRTFTKKGSYLEIRNKEGVKTKSPQTMLDTLVGQISFDPLSFVEEPDARKQRQTLLALLGINLDDFGDKIAAIKDKRLVVGRERDRLAHQVQSIAAPDSECPTEEVSVAELSNELNAAIQHNQDIKKRSVELGQLKSDLQDSIDTVAEWEDEIKALQEKIQQNAKPIKDGEALVKKEEKALQALTPINTAAITEKIKNAETVNQNVRLAKERARLSEEHKGAKAKYDAHTRQINAIEEEKLSVLRSAKMPIEGLSVTDTGVTYNDVPISQISQGEKLRVGVAVSMALNPKLKVLRITNGSLLDSDNLSTIAEMVRDNDYQIWIEKVDDSGRVGLYIEDGEVITPKTKETTNGKQKPNSKG